MRSNCVGHLGNDTFITATRDETDNVFLVTGKLIEERVTPYPLARRVQFMPQSEIELPTNNEAGANIASSSTITKKKDESEQSGLKNVRHSFHTSFDGKFIAAISNGELMHYLIDVLSTRVSQFRTKECVISVAWHPTSNVHLMLLLTSGTLLVIRTDSARLGVLFEDSQEVHLTDIISDFKDYVLTGNDPTLTAELEDPRGRKRNLPPGMSLEGIKQKSPAKMITQCEAKKDSSSSSSSSTSSSSSSSPDTLAGVPDNASPLPACPSAAVPFTETTSTALMRAPLTSDGVSVIAISVIPATRSLPAMLLLLTRSGDAFSMKLSPDGLPASLGKEYDGRVETLLSKEDEKPRDAGPSPCVHYLIRGGNTHAGYEEHPLAIGSALLDEDVGRYVVFVLYSSGVLRGSWFREPDLLCRDHMQQQMDISIALDAALPPEYFLPTPVVPAITHLVGVQTCGNITLIRYDDAVYLCVWPMWCRKAAGWVYREIGTEGYQRLPVVGRSAAIPDPISFRLPYDVTDAGVCVGVNDILIFPEVATHSEPCRRSKPIIVKISSLIIAALFARGERYTLTFGDMNGSASTTDDNKKKEKTENSDQHHHRLEELLEMTSESFNRWICGYPHDAIDSKTVELAKGVKSIHEKMQKRHIDLQRREGQLALRVSELIEKQQQMTEEIVHSQRIVREAFMHRRGVDSLYAANTTFGKIHKLLNELEALAEQRKANKLKGNKLILCEGEICTGSQE